MTPQQRLEAAWQWYITARASLRRLRRLAENYWQELPWEGDVQMGRDNLVGKLQAGEVAGDAEVAESRLDDLAVIELFSVFEGIVRTVVADQVRDASVGLSHPVLKAAARSAVEAAEHRSFAEILNSYSKGGYADLAEQVRQVRRYRNWLSHGRRGSTQRKIDPRTVYQRLVQFLALLLSPVAPAVAPPSP